MDKMDATTTISSSKNLNEIWVDLDQMFKLQLREYRENEDLSQFNELAEELGFNVKQREYLYLCLGKYIIENQDGSKASLVGNYSGVKRKRALRTDNDDDACDEEIENESENAPPSKKRKISKDKKSKKKRKLKERNKKIKKTRIKNHCTDEEEKMEETKDVDAFQADLWSKNDYLSPEALKKLEKKNMYCVDYILDHGEVKEYGETVIKYYVKWYGYDKEEDNSWEPTHNLSSTEIKKYWKEKKRQKADVEDYEKAMDELKELSRDDTSDMDEDGEEVGNKNDKDKEKNIKSAKHEQVSGKDNEENKTDDAIEGENGNTNKNIESKDIDNDKHKNDNDTDS